MLKQQEERSKCKHNITLGKNTKSKGGYSNKDEGLEREKDEWGRGGVNQLLVTLFLKLMDYQTCHLKAIIIVYNFYDT